MLDTLLKIKGSKKHFHKRNKKRCWYCGCKVLLEGSKAAPRLATIDHQKPLSKGGYNKRSNKVTACFACNQEKAAMGLDEYRNHLSQAKGERVVFYGELL
jgi:5-methylcytosine-specific restriction endonuclease McrA